MNWAASDAAFRATAAHQTVNILLYFYKIQIKNWKISIMPAVTIEIPNVISECYQQNSESIKNEVRRGFVIWEYLNGHLSLRDCAKTLNITYRGFLELLWSKGIPADGLSESELEEQMASLRNIINPKK
jgi:predicted HTH domain antitoxin